MDLTLDDQPAKSDLDRFIEAFNDATPEQIAEARALVKEFGAPKIIKIPATVARIVVNEKDRWKAAYLDVLGREQRYKAALESIMEIGTRNEGTEFEMLSASAQIAREAIG